VTRVVPAEWTGVPTLTGEVSPNDLGIVLLSENLMFGLPGWWYDPRVNFNRADAFELIRSALLDFKQSGGGTIVDTSGMTLGRDVTLCSRIAKLTGVQVVGATGFEDEHTSIPTHFALPGSNYFSPGPFDPKRGGYANSVWQREIPGNFYTANGGTKEYLMFLFYNEMTQGMVAPGFIRTKFKAGIVKTGCGWNQVNPVEERSIRGTALAARKAGLSVFITCINQARREFELLLDEGLEPGRIIIGHCDDGRAIDLERDKEFARKGAFVAYDRIGWEDSSLPYATSDERRAELVRTMVDAGLAEHIVLSCNAVAYTITGPKCRHSFSHMLNSFIPRLRKSGIEDKAIDTILRENPRRILTRR
jgi:phosphotriesterase-related protein